MAGDAKRTLLRFLLLSLIVILLAATAIQGSGTQTWQPPCLDSLHLKGNPLGKEVKRRNTRRQLIGSTIPSCTYNECRGCKYRCSAEQVPVEGNDPINGAYHYRCVCHR